MNHAEVASWVNKYVAAWRAFGTPELSKIFSKDVSYRVSPWKKPIVGLVDLASFWDKTRSENEIFEIQSEVVAIENNTAVVRLQVDYIQDKPEKWRDLWILTFDDRGLCSVFEEWPFSRDQDDGQDLW